MTSVDDPDQPSPSGVRAHYMVELDAWPSMVTNLLREIVADAGSIRRAARVLRMSRSAVTVGLAVGDLAPGVPVELATAKR